MDPAAGAPSTLLVQQHLAYIQRLNAKKEDFEHFVTEHLRMSGYYWGLTALALMNHLPMAEEDALIGWVLSCQHEEGGFGGSPEGDAHLLYTLSALQVLALYDSLDKCNRETCATYIALASLSILGRLELVKVPKAVEFIKKCRNFDGGYGSVPGAESHAGQVFCCVGALAIAGALEPAGSEPSDKLAWWLAERQTADGGLNGRPEKVADVCYSWWVLSALRILGRLDWIDKTALKRFILACQDTAGGIADKPGNVPDVFHTFFGVAGLSLLGEPGLKPVDAAYALPLTVLQRLGLRPK